MAWWQQWVDLLPLLSSPIEGLLIRSILDTYVPSFFTRAGREPGVRVTDTKVWNMDIDFLMSLISISKLRRFTSITKLGLGGEREKEG